MDHALIVQAHNLLVRCVGQTGSRCETLAAPVYRAAQAADLAGDAAARLLFPLPDLVQKGLATQLVAGLAEGFKLALDHHLGGDAGVVGARLPQCIAALHAAVTNQRIHDGVVEAVTHVQAAGDVWRRNHDGIWLAGALGGEIQIAFPVLIPGGFNGVWLIGFIHGLTGTPKNAAKSVNGRLYPRRWLECRGDAATGLRAAVVVGAWNFDWFA